MNIIWLTKLTDKDQFRRTQMEMSKVLIKRGHSVSLIFARHFTEKKQTQKNIIYIPTINCRILSGVIYGIIILLYLPLLLKKKKIDIVVVSGDTIWSPFILTLKLFHIPIILDLRSLSIDRDRSLLVDMSLYLSRYLFDGFTTITPELGEILKKKYHIQDEKIGLWSSGFSKDLFGEPENQAINDNKIDTHKFVLLHHGTYSPTRGIENLIRSIAELDDFTKKYIKLLLVGIPQNKKTEIVSLCEELNITEKIDIISPVDNEKIPQYIQSCDVGVIPLPPNNQWWRVSVPLKTLEYLAMSKPIIATSIPFHKRLFENGLCGILIDDNEPKTIANAIIYLYKNIEKLYEMGKTGREIVEKYYTWDRSALDFEKFIKKTILRN